MKKRYTQALILALSLCAFSALSEAKVAPITPTTAQSQTVKDALKILEKSHYRSQVFNDQLSAAYLEKYLESLDPSRSFFIQPDIKRYHKHADHFDDDFHAGKLDIAFDIYNTYRKHLIERMEYALELLKKPTQFNFKLDDKLVVDRSEAPWASNHREINDIWYKRTKLSLLNLRLAGKTTEEAAETLTKRYKNSLHRIEQETTTDVFESVVNALAMLYDPHSNYWSPRTAENFDINMSLSLEGIGAVLQSEDEFTKVVRLVPKGPADKQGELKAADRIVGVAQGKGEMEDIVGWRLDEVVDKIRGPKNTQVRLEILPASAAIGSQTKEVTIQRGKVKLEDQAAQKATFELAEGEDMFKIGVIDLPAFYMDFDAYQKKDPNYKSSTRDVSRLLQELMAENVDGVILDLRNNGGGSLFEAANLADLFIDQGPVVQIRTPQRPINRQYRSMSRADYRGPLIVLVNRLSASASEILAGAIQDYSRGLIVGSQSFGKGTVQSVIELKEGRLKITESKFYRVSGDSTQHRGVIPDIAYPAMIDTEQVGESSYDYALKWDQIRPAPHARYFDFSGIIPKLQQQHDVRAANDPDFHFINQQIALANENKDKKTISLNEKERKQEKKDFDSKLMAIENQRRKSKGLKPFASLEEFNNKESTDAEETAAEADVAPNKIDVDGDALLLETGNIMVDYIRMSRASVQKTAKN